MPVPVIPFVMHALPPLWAVVGYYEMVPKIKMNRKVKKKTTTKKTYRYVVYLSFPPSCVRCRRYGSFVAVVGYYKMVPKIEMNRKVKKVKKEPLKNIPVNRRY